MMLNTLKDDAALNFSNEQEFKNFISELATGTLWDNSVLEFLSLSGESNFLTVKPEGTGLTLYSSHSSALDSNVRACAIPSVQARGEISGNGLSVLYDADKEQFAETINQFWRLFPQKKVKVLYQGDKVSAIHSNVYAPISQEEIFNGCSERLHRVFESVTFCEAYWDWNLTLTKYTIKDKILENAYSQIMGTSSEINAQVAISTSDTSLSAVNIVPQLLVDRVNVPLGNNISVVHKGNVNADTVLDKLAGLFNNFNAAFKSLGELNGVKIENMKNCFIKSCTALKLPQKTSSEAAEQLSNVSCTACDVYVELCKLADKIGGSKQYRLQTEEKISKALSWRVGTWRNYDISGVVAWNAKDE